METEPQEQQSQSGGEYERQPVPRHALLGFKSFIGMYAGEHCAGTELMIGPLFVAAGVSAFDLIAGLIVGLHGYRRPQPSDMAWRTSSMVSRA